MKLPNLRKIFVPDEGWILCDADLKGADAQVVAWEANDDELKEIFRSGGDVHQANASLLGCSRQVAKTWVHGTNYGAAPRTLAVSCGLSIKKCEDYRRVWFDAHPGIQEWHERVMRDLRTTRTVRNAFGYRFPFLDRPEAVFTEALAHVPQSTVACVTNRAWLILHRMPGVEVSIQVHDSLVFQVPLDEWPDRKGEIKDAITTEVPYEDPLTIPWDLQTSTKSWGHLQKESW